MAMSRKKLLASLRQLHQERRRLIRHLTRAHKLAIGTVAVVNRKCGNPYCHCAEGSGHPQTLFLFKDPTEGRRRCKLVRRQDEAWMIRAGEHYRQFREDLKQLRAIDQQEKQILLVLMELWAIRYK